MSPASWTSTCHILQRTSCIKQGRQVALHLKNQFPCKALLSSNQCKTPQPAPIQCHRAKYLLCFCFGCFWHKLIYILQRGQIYLQESGNLNLELNPQICRMVYLDLQRKIADYGQEAWRLGVPHVTETALPPSAVTAEVNSHDQARMQQQLQGLPDLNTDQRAVFDEVVAAAEDWRQNVSFPSRLLAACRHACLVVLKEGVLQDQQCCLLGDQTSCCSPFTPVATG